MLERDWPSGHERLHLFRDAASGVTGAIAIHSTALGPAMGGLRLRGYPSLDRAVDDAARLAHAMSLKNSAAGLDLGGGKAVVLDDGEWADPARRARRMQAVGRIVDELGGLYITAEDVGTTADDMDRIADETRWVAGRPVDRGGHGDPSRVTAQTVLAAIRAGVAHRLGASELAGVTVGVQGVGHVGACLTQLLREARADVVVTDTVAERAFAVAERAGARTAGPADFLSGDLDVLAPCALGEVLDGDAVASLRCSVVAGAANNPLATPAVAADLAAAGILYVPDFLANCGGIIHVGGEALGLSASAVAGLLQAAMQRIERVLQDAAESGRTPLEVAVELAKARIARAEAVAPPPQPPYRW
jgi:glutamate dehydrogenase/leucine dehydrogenase